ncbi:class I SAM-dependent methyltransferase [Methanosarcina sp. T3]|uniref:class I SAM-dependent methyltransferase n=1 Tax=Methanosarcina sp. T3 TaxID=3439062 RepID=UPI003F826239
MQEPTNFTTSDEATMKRKGPSNMAERIALIRAGESRRPKDERICYDPYAIRFISPEILEFAARNPEKYKAEIERLEQLFPGLANSAVARVRYFDDVVKASVDDGLEQLVILGAGYDTRAYRIEGLKNIKVFEVDHPDTQRVKIEKVREVFGSLPGHVTYVPLDLEFDKLGQQLTECGYDRSEKTLFVMEGLVMYLRPETMDEILSFIAHNSGKGSAVIFDYGVFRSSDAGETAPEAGKNIRNFTKKRGEPLKFLIRDGEVETFLSERGFSRIQNMTSEDYKKAYFYGKNEGRVVSSLISFAYARVR